MCKRFVFSGRETAGRSGSGVDNGKAQREREGIWFHADSISGALLQQVINENCIRAPSISDQSPLAAHLTHTALGSRSQRFSLHISVSTKTVEKKYLVMSNRSQVETGMREIKSNACLSAGVYLVFVIVDRQNVLLEVLTSTWLPEVCLSSPKEKKNCLFIHFTTWKTNLFIHSLYEVVNFMKCQGKFKLAFHPPSSSSL